MRGPDPCTKNISTNGLEVRMWPTNQDDSVIFRYPCLLAFLSFPASGPTLMDLTFLLSHGSRVFDFGGQEVFYSTHQFFLTTSSICVIVFDSQNYQPSDIEYWAQ